MDGVTDPSSISDVTVRPEILGMETLLSPFSQFITSQRADMFSSNITQALVLDGCEPPRIGSGYEQQFGDYSFDTTQRKSDGQLLDVVPKFEVGYGASHVADSPSKIVILDTQEGVDCITINNHAQLYNGFGYRNNILPNTMFLNSEAGSFLPKEMEFTKPPNHRDGLYCIGTNANVAYMTLPGVVEDAMIISDTFAKKCAHLGLYTTKIVIDEDMVPINLYGTETEPKPFPDIGESVNEEGILIALRKKNADGFADLVESSLSRIQPSTDIITKAPSDAIVFDVQVYSNQTAMKRLTKEPGVMAQLVKYQLQHYTFYQKIITAYYKIKAEGKTTTPRFNDLVTRCMCLAKAIGAGKKINLIDKRPPVKYFIVEITYGYTRKVSKGFKFAGRSGDKSVVSDVWSEADMPVDEQGVRADIIVSPETVVNRLNPSQLYEQFYNRMGKLITDRLRRGELGSDAQAFKYIIGFLTDVRKEYGKQVLSTCTTKDAKEDLLEDVRNEGIYFIIPPFCGDITVAQCDMIAKKYGYIESNVTFTHMLANGTKQKVTTVSPVCIGSKYMYLLSKIPKMQASALELAYVNQFGLPTKPKSDIIKRQHLYGATPIRFGEDEISMLIMGMDPVSVARFMGIRATCPAATELLIDKLLTTKKPSALGSIPMTSKHMINNSVTVKILNHYMSVIGFDISSTSIARR